MTDKVTGAPAGLGCISPIEVVEAIYRARRSGDIDGVLALCSDAIVFSCNADPDRPGSGATFVGKQQVRRHLASVDQHWEMAFSKAGPVRLDERHAGSESEPGATDLRCVISYALRHKASGHILEGVKAHCWRVRDGKVVSLFEALDREFINAFMAMTGTSPSDVAKKSATEAAWRS
jgi:ketosteroid isomerase-like protein